MVGTIVSLFGLAPGAQPRVRELPQRAVLAGTVVDEACQPVPGVDVEYHFLASGHVPWLRSAADQVSVVRGKSDRDGRFALDVPAGVAGTCVATRPQQCAVRVSCVGGDAVLLRLARAAVRTFTVRGLVDDGALQVVFEGPSPLAPMRVVPVQGRLAVPRWAGLGALVLLPDARVSQRSRVPWFGASGADRDRIATLEATPRRIEFAWAAPVDVPRALRFAGFGLPGADACVWRGQRSDGVPFALRGEDCGQAESGAGRRVRGDLLDEVVLVASVQVPLVGDELAFTAYEVLARDGDEWIVPGWAPHPAALLVGRDAAGWRVLAPDNHASSGPARALRAVVCGDDGAPVHGAAVRLRPRHSRPKEAWHGFAGLEIVAGADGVARLPVRLPDGEYEWIAMAPDGRVALGATTVAGEDVDLRVEVATGGNARGLIVDADGEPIAGLMVELRAGRSDVPLSFGWAEHRTFTASDGEFCVRGLALDQTYELVCGSAAWGEIIVDGVRAGESKLYLQLRPPATPR